jgi:hypothetical protein
MTVRNLEVIKGIDLIPHTLPCEPNRLSATRQSLQLEILEMWHSQIILPDADSIASSA